MKFGEKMRKCGTAATVAAWLLGNAGAVAEAQPPVRDPDRFIRKYPRSWLEIRNQNIIMQQRDYSCGAAALATIMHYYWGDDVSEEMVLDQIEDLLTPEELEERVENGLSMEDLRKTAVELGYLSEVGRIDMQKLSESKVPVVVGLKTADYEHFVVVRGLALGWVFLADPSRGNLRMPMSEFADQWIGSAVLVVAKEGETTSKVSRLGIRPEELSRGWLNEQVIRTFPERVLSWPTRSVR